MNFSVSFCVEVAIAQRGIDDAVDLTREGTLPFVPQPGVMLNVGRDDFRKVEAVYWDAEQPNRLTVWFVASASNNADAMTKCGWREM